jgi:hypothetical protein
MLGATLRRDPVHSREKLHAVRCLEALNQFRHSLEPVK